MFSLKDCKVLLAAAALAYPASALAGPCSDDIAQLSRQLGVTPGLGAPISGTVAGPSVAGQAGNAGDTTASDRAQPGGASRAGGGSAGTVGGVSGAAVGSQAAIASGQVATSDQDVRNQSVGKPTAAQAASGGNGSAAPADEHVSQAKMALQNAIDLNAHDDASCKTAITRTRGLMTAK